MNDDKICTGYFKANEWSLHVGVSESASPLLRCALEHLMERLRARLPQVDEENVYMYNLTQRCALAQPNRMSDTDECTLLLRDPESLSVSDKDDIPEADPTDFQNYENSLLATASAISSERPALLIIATNKIALTENSPISVKNAFESSRPLPNTPGNCFKIPSTNFLKTTFGNKLVVPLVLYDGSSSLVDTKKWWRETLVAMDLSPSKHLLSFSVNSNYVDVVADGLQNICAGSDAPQVYPSLRSSFDIPKAHRGKMSEKAQIIVVLVILAVLFLGLMTGIIVKVLLQERRRRFEHDKANWERERARLEGVPASTEMG